MIGSSQDRSPKGRTPSPAVRRLRILALVIGIFMLVWLPFEDPGIRWVILFAIAIASWGAARVLTSCASETKFGLRVYPMIGVLAGLAVTPVSVLLMLFKNGLHGHDGQDFSIDHITSLLQYWYLWAATGFLIGLGILLLKVANKTGTGAE